MSTLLAMLVIVVTVVLGVAVVGYHAARRTRPFERAPRRSRRRSPYGAASVRAD